MILIDGVRLDSSLRGRVVRNGERWEAISIAPNSTHELSFIQPSAFSSESFAAVKVDDAWRSFEAEDVESKMLLLEARISWMEKEMTSMRTTLRDEVEKRIAAEKAVRDCLDRDNEDSSSEGEGEGGYFADIFPTHFESKIRDYSFVSGEASLEKGAAYREWSRLGYDPILVAAMFGDNDRLEWLSACGYSLLSLGAACESCLYLASEFGHLDTVKWILNHIASRNASRSSESEQTVEGAVRSKEKTRRNSEKSRRKVQVVSPNGTSSNGTASSSTTKSKAATASPASIIKALKAQRHKENGLSSLGVAVVNGHAPLVAWFLENGWDTDESMDHLSGYGSGDSLLHIAARHGQNDVITILLHACPDLASRRNHASETPLHVAARHCQCETLQHLLDSGLPSDERDEMNLSPFLAAVNAGNVSVVQTLLNAASDKASVASQHRDGDGSTAFIIACFRGHLELAAHLLENGSKIDEVNSSGNNALAVAAFRGDERVVKFLLSRFGRPEGWNFAIPNGKISGKLKNSNESLDGRRDGLEHRRDASNGSSKSPEPIAREGSPLPISTISSHSNGSIIDPMLRSPSSPLIPRASSNPVIAQQLVNFKSLVNAVNEAGNTPMLLAAYGGHVGALAALNKFGVSVSQSNHLGCTPLLISCLYGHEDAAIWCVERGANMHEKDRIGISPFIASAMSGCLSILEYLLDHGANLHDTTYEDFSALHMAAYCGHAATVQRLLALGLSPVSLTSNGTTALMLAALNGHMETLQVLIAYGMTVNDRLRAAKLAESKGQSAVADYLRTRAYSREVSLSISS